MMSEGFTEADNAFLHVHLIMYSQNQSRKIMR